jgi:hypothetical protein
VRAFVEECCAIGTDREILVQSNSKQHRQPPRGSNHFSTKIEAAVPTVTSSRPRKDNLRFRFPHLGKFSACDARI